VALTTTSALSHVRICDFTGLLAGSGATRFLAALGAQVIRIEDPTNDGAWDFLRGGPPYRDERRGINLGGAFNNHNVQKLGITLNLKSEKGKQILRQLIAVSDVVTENFSANAMERLGFSYEAMRAIRPNIIYVSDCGFGHSGPYMNFKTFGPTVQGFSGLTFSSGLPDLQPAGWGFSYMDHTAAYFMVMAILAAVHHRNVTGEGQYVDCASTEAAAVLNGPAMLDYSVNGRPLRRPGQPDSNHSQSPVMAPHNIYPCRDADTWVAIACRHDGDWARLAGVIDQDWSIQPRWAKLSGRLEDEAELDHHLAAWAVLSTPDVVAAACQAAGVPASAVQTPEERIEHDPNTKEWGLWPEVEHCEMGRVRVEGLPVHLSETDWRLTQGAPCLGQHTDYVLGQILSIDADRRAELRAEGVI
jgi:crotonobetainyl-CoA:carnitine CoA-transferase CaiB-like acyl-CoA transferase